MARTRVTGGRRTKTFMRNIKRAHATGPKGVEVGFFAGDMYPDGTPVTNVALWNEYGTKHVPERPFIRPAVRNQTVQINRLLNQHVDKHRLTVSTHTAKRIGQVMRDEIKKNITEKMQPPNSPATIARKGKNDPLVDTGLMRSKVRYRVIRALDKEQD